MLHIYIWSGVFGDVHVLTVSVVFLMTMVSRKGIELSALVFSAMNCMPSSMKLMWFRNPLFTDLMTTKVSSAYLFHRPGGVMVY